MSQVFITGVSSGLGEALAKNYLNQGARVYGISRRQAAVADHEKCGFSVVDLENFEAARASLERLLDDVSELDLVVLNAGILGKIKDLVDCEIDDLKSIMDINLWANKIVMDTLQKLSIRVKQVVAISSGAAVNGNRGWGGYSLSKAALNMMMKLYAKEMPETHFTALAPGLIDTAMQDYLCGEVDTQQFKTVQRLKDARHTDNMPAPDVAAIKLIECFDKCLTFDSGSFSDIRQLN